MYNTCMKENQKISKLHIHVHMYILIVTSTRCILFEQMNCTLQHQCMYMYDALTHIWWSLGSVCNEQPLRETVILTESVLLLEPVTSLLVGTDGAIEGKAEQKIRQCKLSSTYVLLIVQIDIYLHQG